MNKQEVYLWLRKCPTFASGFIVGALAVSAGWLTLNEEWVKDYAGPASSVLLILVSRWMSVQNEKKLKAAAPVEEEPVVK